MDVMNPHKDDDSFVDVQQQHPCNLQVLQRIVNESSRKVSAVLDILRWLLKTQTEILTTIIQAYDVSSLDR